MLFKNKIKIYVEVDDNLMPVVGSNGLIRYRYQNRGDAAEYTTTKANLTMIPGAEPVELDESVTKPPKPRKVPVTSVKPLAAPDVIPPNTIVAYTDGGASPNPGPAGSGVLLMYGEHSLEIWDTSAIRPITSPSSTPSSSRSTISKTRPCPSCSIPIQIMPSAS